MRPGNLTVTGKTLLQRETGPSHFTRATIRIEDGIIKEVTRPQSTADLVFPGDVMILPGFIDMHVHCREDATGTQNYKEDFQTAGQAALKGGVTALADMPNNPRPPDTEKRLEEKKLLARTCPVDVVLYALARQ
jgi:dihydroorotase